MDGNTPDKKSRITKQHLLKNVDFYSNEFQNSMTQLRRHYNSYEINELYQLAKGLNIAEQQILEKAGFFSEEFKAGLIELRQHYSLDEIIELYQLADEIKTAGGDPVAVLQSTLIA